MNRRGDKTRQVAHVSDPPASSAVASTALTTADQGTGRPPCRSAGRSEQQPAALGAKGNRPGWDERGSGTVYSLGVIAVLLAAAVGIAGLIQAQSATGRARPPPTSRPSPVPTVLSSVHRSQ